MDPKVHVSYDQGPRCHYQVGIFDDEEIVIIGDKYNQNLRVYKLRHFSIMQAIQKYHNDIKNEYIENFKGLDKELSAPQKYKYLAQLLKLLKFRGNLHK
jgi:hypothetical protein